MNYARVTCNERANRGARRNPVKPGGACSVSGCGPVREDRDPGKLSTCPATHAAGYNGTLIFVAPNPSLARGALRSTFPR